MTGSPVDSNEIADVVGPCWKETKAVAALGVSAGTMSAQREAGTLLALPTAGGAHVYPVDQFHRSEGTVEVKPALLPFLRALRSFDAWAVAVLLHTPAPELDEASPVTWLSNGGAPERVARLGEVVAREWAAGGVPG